MSSGRDDYATKLFGEGDEVIIPSDDDVSKARMFVFTRRGFLKLIQLLLVSLHMGIVCYSMWHRSATFVMLVLIDAIVGCTLTLSLAVHSCRYSPYIEVPDLITETHFNMFTAFLTFVGCVVTLASGGYIITQVHYLIISLILFLIQWSLEFRKSFGLYPWGGTGFFSKTPLGKAKSLCCHPVEQTVVHVHYHVGDGKDSSSLEKSLDVIADLKLDEVLKRKADAMSHEV